MPRPGCTWASRLDWLNFYKIEKADGSVVTYGDDRTWSGDNLQNDCWTRANALIALGISAADRVLIVGAGMGFTIECMKLLGLPNVWGLDASPFVQSRKGEVAGSVTLVNVSMVNNLATIRNALDAAIGFRTFHWVISESVLESYNDNEIPTLLNGAEGLLVNNMPLSRCVHIVFTPPFNAAPGVFNEKTMAQWKAMRSTHTWMNAEGYAVA